MPLYEVTTNGLAQRPTADFAALEMYERQDLQRLLRDEISALGEDLLIIGEEFGDWQDARRRIDLLAIDKSGRLTVIEIKRTDDGGHMELQAIRYAAMVSSMGSLRFSRHIQLTARNIVRKKRLTHEESSRPFLRALRWTKIRSFQPMFESSSFQQTSVERSRQRCSG